MRKVPQLVFCLYLLSPPTLNTVLPYHTLLCMTSSTVTVSNANSNNYSINKNDNEYGRGCYCREQAIAAFIARVIYRWLYSLGRQYHKHALFPMSNGHTTRLLTGHTTRLASIAKTCNIRIYRSYIESGVLYRNSNRHTSKAQCVIPSEPAASGVI